MKNCFSLHAKILLVGFLFLFFSVTARAADPPPIVWTPIDELKPLVSGPGVLVADPVSNDKALSNFGAGCARWLQLNVSSNIAFGKTPSWDALRLAIITSPQKNLQLLPAEAKVLSSRLNVTDVVTGTITQSNNTISLKWQVWRLPELKLIGEVQADAPSLEAVVAALPQTGEKLLTLLEGDAKYYQKNVFVPALNARELSLIGSMPWDVGYDADGAMISELEKLSRKSLLASMSYLLYLSNINFAYISNHTRKRWYEAIDQLGEYLFIPTQGIDVKPTERGNLLATEFYLFQHVYHTPTNKTHHFYYHDIFFQQEDNYLARMQSFLGIGGFASYIRYIEKAVQLNNKSPKAWSELALAYEQIAQQQRRSRAANNISEAEWVYLKAAYAQGLAAAQKAVQLDEGNGYYWLQLAKAATFIGDDAVAEHAMDKALLLIPEEQLVYWWALEMYRPRWINNPRKFNDALNQLLQHSAPLSELASGVISASKELQDETVASELRKKIFSIILPYSLAHPQNIKAQFVSWKIGMDMKNGGEAYAASKRFSKLLPNDSMSFHMMRNAAVVKEDFAAAYAAAKKVVEIEKAEDDEYGELERAGKIHYLDVLRAADKKIHDAGRVENLRQYAQISIRVSEFEDAISAFKAIIHFQSSTYGDKTSMAYLYLWFDRPSQSARELKDAIRYINEYFQTHRNEFNPSVKTADEVIPAEIVSLQALVSWRNDKNAEEAQKLFDQAFAKQGAGSAVYANYAAFLLEIGQKEKARQMAAKAKEMGFEDNYGVLKKVGL